MNPAYTCEKLSSMLTSLTFGEGDIRSRLVDAFHAEWMVIQEEGFPEEYRVKFRSLEKIIERYEKKAKRLDSNSRMYIWQPNYYWVETFRGMRNKTGVKIAWELWELHSDLEWWLKNN